jgi:LysR family transcriptional regulator of gallate degradation
MVGPQPLASLMAVADQGSGPRAGDQLGRSQPTIHRHLTELEHLVGVPLFQRTPRGTRLTPSGDAILRGAKLAWAEIATAQDELAAFAGRLHGSVRVAALPLSSGFLLPRALDRLLRRHPQLQITVVDGTYEALLQQLRCAEVDMIVGALRPQPAPADVTQQLLFNDRLAVIARRQHACLGRGRPLSLAELAREPWIVPLPGTPARAVFERVFDAEGLASPQAQLQVNSPSVVRSLLLETDRIALLSPWQVDAELRSGQLVALPLALRAASRAIGVSTRRDGHLSPGALALLVELRAVAEQLASPALQAA